MRSRSVGPVSFGLPISSTHGSLPVSRLKLSNLLFLGWKLTKALIFFPFLLELGDCCGFKCTPPS